MADTLSKINQIKILSENVANKNLANSLKGSEGKELRDVAEQFEAIFVHQMLKQARQSKLADGIFSSEAQDTFNDTATTEIYTLSLHDALPICHFRSFKGCWSLKSTNDYNLRY